MLADAQIVSDVRHGTGRIINNEQAVGGCPNYASGEAPVETTNNGISYDWKKARGLPLNHPHIANTVNADGYTTLEMYLTSLVTP